ncbi:uncharacterized protein LOC134838360 isoform X2 [Culicoides brevitarsis]|uniref:uncharacterized protein LOC134838360 isoform X2 n=1 Tax=Culicoides brevitarsis TaxID=469753 RepID=UPI00307B30F8
MFVDVVELLFDSYGKVYHPGDVLTCHIVVHSAFNLNCKFVRARLIAPYKNSKNEYFRVYRVAKLKKTSLRTNGTLKEEVGEEAENFKLKKGRNRFVVTVEIPDVPSEAFKEYKDVLRCSFKVTVKLNWLLKLHVLDWFILNPASVTEAVVDKIDAGINYMMKSIGKVRSLTRNSDPRKEFRDMRRTNTMK